MKLINKLFAFIILAISLSGYSDEWKEHEFHLKISNGRVKDAQSKIEALVKLKNSTQNKVEQKKAIQEIELLQRKIEEYQKDLDEEKAHVKFNHPNKADNSERKYFPTKSDHVEVETQDASDSVEKLLNSFNLQMYKTYGDLPKEEQGIRRPASDSSREVVEALKNKEKKTPMPRIKVEY